jgi:NADH dehydrogenase [ubiquinone] 1 alpha subcomplex assembly factor 7
MPALKDALVALITEEGPISVERYMALCLGHPTLGYYTTRDPFGAEGDFTTAPEISQIFGELLGLWVAQVWLDMGSPASCRLIEIGPGRGTLMADALRAVARALPPCLDAVSVHMVETSPVLRRCQQATLGERASRIIWHERVEHVLDGPVIILANELLDALPVRQFIATPDGWRERLVGLSADGALCFGLAPGATAGLGALLPAGTVLEVPQAADALVGTLAAHVASQGGAALLIDYGATEAGTGDTLQAVQRHRFVDPLAEPGQADLTTQVQFARVKAVAVAHKARVHGPVAQGVFLARLGLAERADALMRHATPSQAAAIAAATERLAGMKGLAPTAMGTLFKAIAITGPRLGLLPGFDSADAAGE